MERGERSTQDFMDGIIQMVSDLVKSYEGVNIGADAALSQSAHEVIGQCPRCGKPVYEGKKSFYCSAYKDNPPCGFVLWLSLIHIYRAACDTKTPTVGK